MMNDTGVSNDAMVKDEDKGLMFWEDDLPLGYRFYPTDEELIELLQAKVDGKQFVANANRFIEADLYAQNPQELTGSFMISGRDLAWFFFTPRHRKSPGTNMPRRAVNDVEGWRSVGKEMSIMNVDGKIVGFKSILDFYHQTSRLTSKKMEWRMIEYRLNRKHDPSPKDEGGAASSSSSMLLDACVLCKVFKTAKSQTGDQKGPVGAANNNSNQMPMSDPATFDVSDLPISDMVLNT